MTAALVPALAEAHAARVERMKRMGMVRPNVVPMARVRVVEPEPEVAPQACEPELPEFVEIPNFLVLRRSDLVDSGVLRPSDGRVILRHVSRITGVRVIDLKSARRNKEVILPRQIACWVMREHTLMSLPQIGRHLGGRDHSTVNHAINKIEDLRKVDPEVRRLSDEIAASACAEMLA